VQRLKWAVKALGPAECRDTDKSDTAYYFTNGKYAWLVCSLCHRNS